MPEQKNGAQLVTQLGTNVGWHCSVIEPERKLVHLLRSINFRILLKEIFHPNTTYG